MSDPTTETSLQLPTGAQMVTLEELNKKYIAHVLDLTKGRKSAAAKILGINRRTLYRKNERRSVRRSQTEVSTTLS